MKKVFAILLTLTMALSLLAACGASETEPGITGELGQRYEPIELRWQTATFHALAYPEDEAWQATAAGLHAVTNRLIVVSAIDNLCRGASGQALANANLMCGLPVDCGLNAAPMLP